MTLKDFLKTQTITYNLNNNNTITGEKNGDEFRVYINWSECYIE